MRIALLRRAETPRERAALTHRDTGFAKTEETAAPAISIGVYDDRVRRCNHQGFASPAVPNTQSLSALSAPRPAFARSNEYFPINTHTHKQRNGVLVLVARPVSRILI